MEYKGRIFGKVGNNYFDTGKTADDWDNLEARNKDLESENKKLTEERDHWIKVSNLLKEAMIKGKELNDSLNWEENHRND